MIKSVLVDMRDAFFHRLGEHLENDSSVIVLTADHGCFALSELQMRFPDRVINVGIAEQNMLGVAAGLASAGKKVFVHGIAPFVSSRVLEQITLDVAAANLSVNIVAVGSGFTYSTDGYTHHGLQDIGVVTTVPKLTVLNSSDPLNTASFADYAVERQGPKYIRIEKEKLQNLLRESDWREDLKKGFSVIRGGSSPICVISTGIMTQVMGEVESDLDGRVGRAVSPRILDLFQLAPIKSLPLKEALSGVRHIFTVDEGHKSGIFSIICAWLQEVGLSSVQVHFVGVNEGYITLADKRGNLQRAHGLSPVQLQRLFSNSTIAERLS